MLSSSTASRSPFSAGEGKGTVNTPINPNLNDKPNYPQKTRCRTEARHLFIFSYEKKLTRPMTKMMTMMTGMAMVKTQRIQERTLSPLPVLASAMKFFQPQP